MPTLRLVRAPLFGSLRPESLERYPHVVAYGLLDEDGELDVLHYELVNGLKEIRYDPYLTIILFESEIPEATDIADDDTTVPDEVRVKLAHRALTGQSGEAD